MEKGSKGKQILRGKIFQREKDTTKAKKLRGKRYYGKHLKGKKILRAGPWPREANGSPRPSGRDDPFVKKGLIMCKLVH